LIKQDVSNSFKKGFKILLKIGLIPVKKSFGG
jgi:hypothetical protein